MSECRIRRFAGADGQAYASYVEHHEHAMLYHSLPYVQLIAGLTTSRNDTLLSFDADGRLNGVLPVLSKDGPIGRVINSLPYYGSHGGPLASTAEAEAALVGAYNELACSQDVAAATMVGNPMAGPGPRTNVAHTLTDYRIGQFTTLDYERNHADALMASFHHKTRNMVRKSRKGGMSVAVENGMVEFLRDVHQQNIRAIGGLPKTDEFFDTFPRRFQPDRDFKIWVARDRGEPVAAMLLFYFRQTVEYFTPAVIEAARTKQPLTLLIFEGMVDASQREYKAWNWGGTWATQDGLYLFKARWGTRDINYTYFVQINNSAVAEATPERLRRDYSNFFVIPFQRLRATS